MNSGFQNDLSVNNVRKICKILKKDLVIVNPIRYRVFAVSEALKISSHLNQISTNEICDSCEKVYRRTCIKEAQKRSIHTIVWGSTNFEDQVPAYFPGWSKWTFRNENESRRSAVNVLRSLGVFGKKCAVVPASLIHMLKFSIYRTLINIDLGGTVTFNKFNPFSEVNANQTDLRVVYFF